MAAARSASLRPVFRSTSWSISSGPPQIQVPVNRCCDQASEQQHDDPQYTPVLRNSVRAKCMDHIHSDYDEHQDHREQVDGENQPEAIEGLIRMTGAHRCKHEEHESDEQEEIDHRPDRADPHEDYSGSRGLPRTRSHCSIRSRLPTHIRAENRGTQVTAADIAVVLFFTKRARTQAERARIRKATERRPSPVSKTPGAIFRCLQA